MLVLMLLLLLLLLVLLVRLLRLLLLLLLGVVLLLCRSFLLSLLDFVPCFAFFGPIAAECLQCFRKDPWATVCVVQCGRIETVTSVKRRMQMPTSEAR